MTRRASDDSNQDLDKILLTGERYRSIFNTEEQYDMIRCYYKAHYNSRIARELYAELYPDRRLPSRGLFFQTTRRAREDPNIDMDQFLLTDDDSDTDDEDKEKARLAMNRCINPETLPIVYTTRLEQMSIFREDVLNIEPKKLLKAILKESKPKLEEYKTICNKNYSRYDKMVQKLDDVFKFNKTKSTGNTILIDDDDSELSSDDDWPNQMIVDNANSTANNMTNVEFEADEAVVPTQLFENIDADVIIVEKYRSVFLSFSCTNTNATDLYYIDKNGLVTLHNRITINEKCEVSEYVGPTETFIFFYCCWYKRRELTLELDELPKKTLEFVSERHNCILSSCTCCCSPQKLNAIKIRNTTGTQRNEPLQSKEVAETSDVTVIDDDDTLTIKDEPMISQSIEQAMEYEIGQLQEEIINAWQQKNKQKRTMTKERKRFIVGTKNKWLQEVISAVPTPTAGTATPENSFVTAIMKHPTKDLTKSSKLLKPNTIYRPEAHMVIHVKSIGLYEIYEINRGKLISSATCINKDFLSREVFKKFNKVHIMNNLAEDISLASRESSVENIVSDVTVPCCWYLREVLINARHGAYDFMREPHTCAVGHCNCCCKSLRLADTNKKIHLYVKNKSFNRLLVDYVDTNYLIQFNNIDMESKREASRKTKSRFEVIVTNTVSSHSNISQKQVSSNMTQTKNKVTAAVQTLPLGPDFSLLNDQIQKMEIDDDDDDPSSHPPAPPDSQMRPDSHTLVLPTQTTEEEKPSSKITLFTPDMACTITTYALDTNAILDELVDCDPLDGTSADVKDCIHSSFVTKDEIEDNDETGSRDLESDPLIYANTEEDGTAYDPLEVDDTLIEIKDEPLGIPTNSSVVNDTFGSATSQNVPDKTVNVNVEHLISSILERFRDVKLFINEEGHVTADIGVCVSSLTTGELKVLANILSHAQEQVQNLVLVPGTVLRGQIPIPACGNQLPSFMVPETNGEMVFPRIENVFSLKDVHEKQQEAAKLRVRPLHELGVTETKTLDMAQANATFETPTPVSWLQTALTSDMKPINIRNPVDPLAQTSSSSSTYDPPKIPKFVISKAQYQSGSTQTPPKSCSQKNIDNPTKECRSDCICNDVTKNSVRMIAKKPRFHPFAKKFDQLKYNFLEYRSQCTRSKPLKTFENPRRNMPLITPTAAASTSAKSATVTPTSSVSAVVISIDSDDDD